MATNTTEETTGSESRSTLSNAKLAGYYLAIIATLGLAAAFLCSPEKL